MDRTISGHDIRAYRRSLGVDQIRFAEVLGVNQATISRWERGRTPIDQVRCRGIFQHLERSGTVEKPIEPFGNVNMDGHWPSLIKLYRQARGISQMLLAELLDVDVTTIYRWENGLVPPSLKEQIRLRDLLLKPLSVNANLPGLKSRIARSPQSVSLAYGYVWIAYSESVRRRYLAMGFDLRSNPSLAPHDTMRSDDSRVIHADWTQERLRAGFWRGEVPISRCTFEIDERSALKVAAFPIRFEDGLSLTILQSRIVKQGARRTDSGGPISILHADEIVG
ncbi:MAG: helix-turn-helix domain-containing protein [Alphaproteobacteria bacterium]|nr:helix-turn-helix domain-containing protein [Alphaproteobacteria bacterium]